MPGTPKRGAMGKKKGKKKLTAEPWAGPGYLDAEAAQEQRLEQLGSGEPEPEPEPVAACGSAGASASAGERELPHRPEPELPWEEVDAYLEAAAAGGKAQQLAVRSQSGVEYVHLDLGALADLKELRLPNNALLELPASLFGAGAGLPQLQVIDLSSNRLRSLPSSIVRLPKLQVLNVAANELTALPDVGCLAALKTLNLTNNQLTALPEWFVIR